MYYTSYRAVRRARRASRDDRVLTSVRFLFGELASAALLALLGLAVVAGVVR